MGSAKLRLLRNMFSRQNSGLQILLLFIVISFVFYIAVFKNMLFLQEKYFVNLTVAHRGVREADQGEESRKKLILLYTPFFGQKWANDPSLGPNRSPFEEGHTTFMNCEVSSCLVTYNRSRILEADAVGFHARDMPEFLPSRMSSGQIWFYFVLENPLHVPMDAHGFAGVFNWTMSYSRDSEVYTPYGKYITLEKPSEKYLTGNETAGKSKQVAWLVSNCQATERYLYVMELQNYIHVSIYGLCGRLRCPRKRRWPVCNALLKQHKFYLAFENGNCPDYMTEKYWENAIDNDIIPIVMGGANYKVLAIPNSYIDVQDFDSPKHLADYLLYLDANDTAYSEYFAWKKFYKRVATNRACVLCNQLHNQTLYAFPRVYEDMRTFWDKNHCKELDLVKGNS